MPRGCMSLPLLSSCPGHSLVSYLWPQTYLTREEGTGHLAPPALPARSTADPATLVQKRRLEVGLGAPLQLAPHAEV